MRQNVIAVVCDCDGTLTPDTTNFLLESNGVDTRAFWKKNEGMVRDGWDPPIAWMTDILTMINDGTISQDTNAKLRELGARITPQPGADSFAREIRARVGQNVQYAEAGINVEFYIISSGFEEIIRGTPAASGFNDIFAGTYAEDGSGKIYSIKSAVSFTEKTKFLYAINKGIPGSVLRREPGRVNDRVLPEHRRVPFENMIYLGDSDGDVPCLSAIKGYNGHGIAVSAGKSFGAGYSLARGRRTTAGPYAADYTHGSDLRRMLDETIDQIAGSIMKGGGR